MTSRLDALGVCGGDCDADAVDGICDDEDDCVGELDACGICNGPGAIYECGCSDIPEVTATVTETSSTPLAIAVATALLTTMPMAFVVTSTTALENLTFVVLQRSWRHLRLWML